MVKEDVEPNDAVWTNAHAVSELLDELAIEHDKDYVVSSNGTLYIEWETEGEFVSLEIGESSYGITIIRADSNSGENGPLDDLEHLKNLLTGKREALQSYERRDF